MEWNKSIGCHLVWSFIHSITIYWLLPICQILFERLGILQWTKAVPTRQLKSNNIDTQCWVISTVRKMDRDKEILEHVVKLGVSKVGTFDQRPQWSERGVIWPWWWCQGCRWFWAENNIPEHLLYTWACLNASNEQDCWTLALFINGAVCSVSIFCIIPFFNCLIFWNWNISTWGSPFILPNCLWLPTLFSERRAHRCLLFRDRNITVRYGFRK